MTNITEELLLNSNVSGIKFNFKPITIKYIYQIVNNFHRTSKQYIYGMSNNLMKKL